MKIETRIKLDKFKPRWYQLPVMDALLNKGYKKIIAVLPRRAGKDMMGFNLAIRQCIAKVCIVWYIFPTYKQAKEAIWHNITIDGIQMLDYIPAELIESKNSQEMKIQFTNGSILKMIGSDNPDSLRGTNPYGTIWSEYAYQNDTGYSIIRPILAANGGWALFLSTPFGKNHFYHMFQMAKEQKDWFTLFLTLEDTQHISYDEIEIDRREKRMSEDRILQEYYCSFERGAEGSIYNKYIQNIRLNNQIGMVPWEPAYKVHTCFDLGYADKTTILWFQTVGSRVLIIDAYENNHHGLEHYIKIIKEKPYVYGKHFAPPDIEVHEFTSGITRRKKALELGISFTVVDKVGIEDGIEAVRSHFPKLWIDQKNCKEFLRSIENYRYEWDDKKGMYKDNPLHDWSSHYADALRYLCVSLPKTADRLTSEELDRRYAETVYGMNRQGYPFEEPYR